MSLGLGTKPFVMYTGPEKREMLEKNQQIFIKISAYQSQGPIAVPINNFNCISETFESHNKREPRRLVYIMFTYYYIQNCSQQLSHPVRTPLNLGEILLHMRLRMIR